MININMPAVRCACDFRLMSLKTSNIISRVFRFPVDSSFVVSLPV